MRNGDRNSAQIVAQDDGSPRRGPGGGSHHRLRKFGPDIGGIVDPYKRHHSSRIWSCQVDHSSVGVDGIRCNKPVSFSIVATVVE